jgi:4-hydroxy-tetrahydrodipicolinate reductase
MKQDGQDQAMTRIGIIGSAGRMGKAIADAIADAGATLAGGIDAGGDAAALARSCDVLVDFSVPAALVGNVGAAVAAGVPIVIGTTGLGPDDHQTVDDAAAHVAVLQTGNTSLGVTLLAALVREAAARLGPTGTSRSSKCITATRSMRPSGTALLLGKAAADGRGITLAANSDVAATG